MSLSPRILVLTTLLGSGGLLGYQLLGELHASQSFFGDLELALAERQERSFAVTAARDHLQHATESATVYASADRGEAALQEASRHIRARRPSEAALLLERVAEVPQDSETLCRSALLRTQLVAPELALEHHEEANAHCAPDYLTDWRLYWQARDAMAAGYPELVIEKLDSLSSSLSRFTESHDVVRLRAEALAQISGSESDGARAIAEFLSTYPEYPRAPELEVIRARALLRASQPREAGAIAEDWMWRAPYLPQADAFTELFEDAIRQGYRPQARSREDERLRGRELRLKRHWEIADSILRDAYHRALREGAEGLELNQIRFQLALNDYDRGDFEGCLRWMEDISASDAPGVSERDRAKWTGRALSRLNRDDEAWEIMTNYYDGRPERERFDALYEFSMDLGRYDDAVALRTQHMGQRAWRSFDGAFLLFLQGNFASAHIAFQRLINEGSDGRRERYWLARTLQELGHPDAETHFTSLSSEDPLHYYGIQARSRLLDMQRGGSGPARVHWCDDNAPTELDERALYPCDDLDPFDLAREQRRHYSGAVENFASRWEALFPQASAAAELMQAGAAGPVRQVLRDIAWEVRALRENALSGELEEMARIPRLTHELWSHTIDNRRTPRGWWGINTEEARYPAPTSREQTAAAIARYRMMGSDYFPMVQDLRAALIEAGDDYLVRRFGLDESAPPLGDEDPRRHSYPTSWAEFFEPFARRERINPWLLWSLMLVESDANPDSVSVADAYGLLQVIPKTGHLIARDLEEETFGIHQLLEPHESLRYGSWYLRQLLDKFQGQEMLALVSYNAGPHQVERWLGWRGDQLPMDAFIETVPYRGARRYPQRILRYLAVYRSTYFDQGPFYVGNTIDTNVLDNIYY